VVGVVCCTGEVGYYGEDQIDWKMEIRTRIKIRTRKRDTILKDNLWRDFFDTELRSPSGKDPSPRRRGPSDPERVGTVRSGEGSSERPSTPSRLLR
jgi:hypothetical protein